MERGFQSLLLNGKYAVGDDYYSALANSDEASINRDMSLQTLNVDKSMLSLTHYQYASSYDTLDGNLRSRKSCECSKEEGKWRRVDQREEILKRLKHEPSTEQFNFSPAIMFGQLPELQSVEPVNRDERRLKQSFPPIAATTNPLMLEPTLTQFQLTPNYITPVPLRQIKPPVLPPAKLSTRDQARRRRNTLSDKTRTLQKVLPWDKKMDMATVYEETYKYIKFLQAQISVLQSMPVASTSTSSSHSGSENPRYGNQYAGLGKLNRQQLLEVLVNSPATQTILYSKGCCVYSFEQLILFNDISEKNLFIAGLSVLS